MARARDKRLIDQAALQSLVRFGPQLDALDQLTRDAGRTYRGTVSAAAGSAASTSQAIRDARPGVAKIYDQAGLKQAGLNDTLLSGDLAGLSGSGTDLIKAEASTEAHLAATHMNEAKVQALQDLTNRGLQAQAGRASAIRQAGATYASDLGDIAKARLSLSGQAGAFKSATLGDLLDTKAGRQFTATQNQKNRDAAAANNRADNKTSRQNTKDRVQATKDAAKVRAQQKQKGLLPNGVKKATPQQHGAARDKVELAISTAAPFVKSGKLKRDQIEQLLVQGAPAETKKNPDGTSKHLAGIPKSPELLARAALDILYTGFVSKKTRRLLNARGLTVGGMGYPGPGSPQAKGYRAKQVGNKVAKAIKDSQSVAPFF